MYPLFPYKCSIKREVYFTEKVKTEEKKTKTKTTEAKYVYKKIDI